MIRPDDNLGQYLESLSGLCMEVARTPTLLPVFLQVLALVSGTVEELQRRRVAA